MIADAHEILDYLHETIAENDLAGRIYLGHKVVRADWSSQDARWTVTVQRGVERFEVSCNILFSAAGYYDHAAGYTPHFEGRDGFAGRIVHPQAWPEDLDYTGKRVVVIGSGATAVTLIPAMADRAAHVTMLQRSPSYVLPIPRQDAVANTLRRLLPDTLAYRITRRVNIARQRLIFKASKRYPKPMRRLIRHLNARALPEGYAIDTHFNPQYNPWDQRLCMVPDGDMFKAITAGKASVVTDRIARFTQRGILLESGRELDADIIVTATGFQVRLFGGIALQVDGKPVNVPDRMVYKSMMLSDVPNFAFALGYTNLSWTLKVDLVCDHLCQILAHMDRHGYTTVTPVADDPTITRQPMLDFASGYVLRSIDLFPQRGSHGAWTVEMSYAADRARLRNGPVEDPALQFGTSVPAVAGPEARELVTA